MIIIGVTGGIGAGKSTVSLVLKELGAILIDADLISRQVVEPNQQAYLEIIKTFGETVLNDDDTIDRKKLAKIVFTSDEKRRLIEKIIHKEVVRVIKERINNLKRCRYNGIVVLDVPIPVKEGFLDTVDKVWVVVSDDEIRLKRIMSRGGITIEDAQNRINSQLSQEEYMELAHEVIYNNDDFIKLKEKVLSLNTSLKEEVFKDKFDNDLI